MLIQINYDKSLPISTKLTTLYHEISKKYYRDNYYCWC